MIAYNDIAYTIAYNEYAIPQSHTRAMGLAVIPPHIEKSRNDSLGKWLMKIGHYKRPHGRRDTRTNNIFQSYYFLKSQDT